MEGLGINYWIVGEAIYNFLEKEGYTTVRLVDLLKKYYGFKTIPQIQDKLAITRTALNIKISFNKKTKGKMLEALDGFVGYCEKMIVEEVRINTNYHRVGSYELRNSNQWGPNGYPENTLHTHRSYYIFHKIISKRLLENIDVNENYITYY